MIRLDRCSGSCNTLDNLSTKIYVWSKTIGVYIKVFNRVNTNRWSKKIDKISIMWLKKIIQIKYGLVTTADISAKNQ